MVTPPEDLARDEAHPRAREALTDAFFWDASDPTGPFGGDTAREVLEEFRAFRADEPRGALLELLGELLERWEIADTGWEVVDEPAVLAMGAEDELGLLVRDEAIIALAFAQIVDEGRIHPEIRRRAFLALARQALPALLHGFGDAMRTREKRVARMREVLAMPWTS
jgi:uncharacterized protein YfeS